MGTGERHPIQAGFLAVGVVAVGLGLVAALVAIVGTHEVGLDGSSSAANVATLYVPASTPDASDLDTTAPSVSIPRDSATAPSVADLEPSDTADVSASSSATSSSMSASSSPPANTASVTPPAVLTNISLSASVSSVAPMAPIQLTGKFPGGDGEVMLVQRKGPGDADWHAFPVPGVAVAGGSFSQIIEVAKTGISHLRVIDQDTQAVSNAVTVMVG